MFSPDKMGGFIAVATTIFERDLRNMEYAASYSFTSEIYDTELLICSEYCLNWYNRIDVAASHDDDSRLHAILILYASNNFAARSR